MRHDIHWTRPGISAPIPFKRFTWGYEFHDSRWWLYWMFRFPGRTWQLDYARSWRCDQRRYCWCRMVLTYREHGFWDGSTPETRTRRYEISYRPIELVAVGPNVGI